MTNDDALRKFYRDLLSLDWNKRLEAYSSLENDLKERGLEFPEDSLEMKLLIGQILSIYFKKIEVQTLDEFKTELKKIYKKLLSPLFMDKSKNYNNTKKLLVNIYDDDDNTARKDIESFFKNGVSPQETALSNLIRCYDFMMQKIKRRTIKMSKPRKRSNEE